MNFIQVCRAESLLQRLFNFTLACCRWIVEVRERNSSSTVKSAENSGPLFVVVPLVITRGQLKLGEVLIDGLPRYWLLLLDKPR